MNKKNEMDFRSRLGVQTKSGSETDPVEKKCIRISALPNCYFLNVPVPVSTDSSADCSFMNDMQVGCIQIETVHSTETVNFIKLVFITAAVSINRSDRPLARNS